MKITKLPRGNSQFPQEKGAGDVVVLSNNELFCYDGSQWRLIGGRFLPSIFVDNFVSYIGSGWPDPQSARFDFDTIFNLGAFGEYYGEDGEGDKNIQKWLDIFKDRVLETSEKIFS